MEQRNKKVILIADYGRSGQGWLSYMLCYILNAQYVEPYDFLHGVLYSPSQRVRDLTSGNLPEREKTQYAMVIKTHNYPAKDFNLTDKIIFLSRDPRDVAISAYYRYNLISKQEKHRSLHDRIFYLIHYYKFTSFMLTAYKWNKHCAIWKGRKDIPMYAVRYEDLSMNTENTLGGILRYLKVGVPAEFVLEAVEAFSFTKLSGRKKGQEDAKSAPFRKGIIGDYKNHCSWLHLKLFQWICGKEAEKLGYTL